MKQLDLDQLDAEIAALEGKACTTLNRASASARHDHTPYKPTRQRGEAMRLMDKYIDRMVKTSGCWAAIGQNGRAYMGPTSLIAICMAVVGNAKEPLAA